MVFFSIHLWQVIRTRTKFFIPFLIGTFMEFVGYCGRTASARQAPDYRLMAYVIQSTYVLLAPTLLAASIYMELGRIIRVTDGERHSVVSSKKITKCFVTGDILCLSAQSGGGGLSAAGYSSGTSIVIAGLALQLAVFLCFVVLAASFHLRLGKVPTSKSLDPSMLWQRHMLAIFVGSCLIFTRSAIRLAEYAEGFTGYLYTHEWCLYLLDFVLMMLVVTLFVWIHPSEINAMLKG